LFIFTELLQGIRRGLSSTFLQKIILT